MSGSTRNPVRGLSRRAVLGGLALGLAAAPALAAADHPSVTYMKKVAKDMLNAHRQGTIASFRRAILRHADLASISDYCLGQYRGKLPAGQKDRYYNGVASFMARYFTDQSREYPVSKYEIGEATAEDGKNVSVSSKIYLMNGQSYTVLWKLVWSGGRYKVNDVKVMGFSLVYLQRGIFLSFLSKRNGDVGQLVLALNR